MAGPAVTIVDSGGLPVKQVDSGAPVLTAVDSGGVAVTLSDNGVPFVVEGGSVVRVAYAQQSEDARGYLDTFNTGPAVTLSPEATGKVFVAYAPRTSTPDVSTGLTWEEVTSSSTNYLKALANAWADATGGKTLHIAAHLKSGTNFVEMLDDADTDRQFSVEEDIADLFKTESGGEPEVLGLPWFAAPSSLNTDYAEGAVAAFFGKDLDGNDLTIGQTFPVGGSGADMDHFFLPELYPSAKLAMFDAHVFIPTEDLKDANTNADDGPATALFNKQRSRASVMDFYADNASGSGGPFEDRLAPLGPHMNAYENGVLASPGVWSDWTHPAAASADGLTRRGYMIGYSLAYVAGRAGFTRPVFDNSYWEPTGAYVEFWSSAGDITTTRIERSEAALNPATQSHWQPVVGFEVNGVPAENVEIVSGRVRVYKNVAEDPFTSTDSITFGLGGASGYLLADEDPIAQLWKNWPIVDVGLTLIEGLPVAPVPAASVLANPLPSAVTTFTVGADGPFFQDTLVVGSGVTSVVFAARLNFASSPTDAFCYLLTLAGARLDFTRLVADGTLRLSLADGSAVLSTYTFADSAVAASGWANIMLEVDIANGTAELWLGADSDNYASVDSTTFTAEPDFDNVRKWTFLARNNGSGQFEGAVEYIRLWHNATVSADAEPGATPDKELSGDAATINADAWKLGSDAT